jgi:anti-sigma factor RsiW
MTELSDELLVAYVDGQLARKQTRAVEKVLAQDDVIARRVDALKDAHSRLEAAFEAILSGEEAEISAKPGPQRPGIFIAWATAAKIALTGAGLAAALVLAVAGYGWPLVMPELARHPSGATDPDYVGSLPPSWQEEAARAQALISRASLEVGLESQGNQDLIAFQLAPTIGPALKLPDLQPQGFRFVRAQLLRSGEEPLAQLLYLATSGAPLALYAKKGGEGTGAPVFKQYGAIGSVAWSQDGIAYLLAGEGDEASLMRLAERIGQEPQAPAPSPPEATSQEAPQATGSVTPPYSPLPKPLTQPGPAP